MLKEKLKKYNIFLGSSSPRRKQLLSDLGLSFKVIKTNKKEIYPKYLTNEEIVKYLAKQKSFYLEKELKNNFLLITADTIVILKDQILNKPKNHIDATNMLSKLSNQTHQVITGVCIKSINKEVLFTSTTNVKFRELSKVEINYYVKNYNPLDKSGGYGIQEWIGQIGIESIKGSYFNVVGLPISKLYENLKKF